MARPLIAASILDADFSKLGLEVQIVNDAGIDLFTLDVMDGTFVQRITFGDMVVARVREMTPLPIDVHLMVGDPSSYVEKMWIAGADIITFHIEVVSEQDALRLIDKIRSYNLGVGIAVNLETEIPSIMNLVNHVDLINLMAVSTGYGGQSLDNRAIDKLTNLRNLFEKENLDVAVEIDGGVKHSNCSNLFSSGADFVTVGTGIYHSIDRASAVKSLIETAANYSCARPRAIEKILMSRNPVSGRSQRQLDGLVALRESLDIAPSSWPITGVDSAL